jgi:FAD/FMN-containing dehydrogenase/ferredoxin
MNANELRAAAPGIVILDTESERDLYSHDIGDLPLFMTKWFFRTQPDFIVQPKDKQEIQAVLAFANQHRVPVTPKGAASWGLGGAVPTSAGIVLDLSPMRDISSIDPIQKTVTVQAGARWSDVERAARKAGLCLMTYPSSKFSTVGGWISTGGYGINNFKYGHVSEQIESIVVVTPDGAVRRLSQSDRDFSAFVSTEGVLGIIVEATIKLREIPQGSFPHLLYFPGDSEAFSFLSRYAAQAGAAGHRPNFLRFLDENHLAEINELMRNGIFKPGAAVLLEFGAESDEDYFVNFTARENGITEAPLYVASYLWNERLFGMKTKRLGPTILASEIIIPLRSAAAFMARAKKIGKYFGVSVCIDSFVIDPERALIMSTFLCDSRKKRYILNLPLVAMLTREAVARGGQPYGLGLWNSAFIHSIYSKAREHDLKSLKDNLDPNHILNPGKALSRGGNRVSSLFFQPVVFTPAISLLLLLAPAIGRATTLFLGKDKKVDRLDYELSMHACAKCGNCTAVCPAYLVTHDETLTAKGKIALAKKLLAKGNTITREEAASAFLCMHCRACEEVCETNLELMMLFDALEKRLRAKFGWPEAEITEFMKKVDGSRVYWDMVEQKS